MGLLNVDSIRAEAEALIAGLEASNRLLTGRIDVLVATANRTPAQEQELAELRAARRAGRDTIARTAEQALQDIDNSDDVRNLLRSIDNATTKLNAVAGRIAHIAKAAETVAKATAGATKLAGKLKSFIGEA